MLVNKYIKFEQGVTPWFEQSEQVVCVSYLLSILFHQSIDTLINQFSGSFPLLQFHFQYRSLHFIFFSVICSILVPQSNYPANTILNSVQVIVYLYKKTRTILQAHRNRYFRSAGHITVRKPSLSSLLSLFALPCGSVQDVVHIFSRSSKLIQL